MREVWQSRSPRKPMMLSIAVAFAFAAAFGDPRGEQLSQASQAAPVETSITFEDRFVRLILPRHTHAYQRQRLPLILHLHGAVPFPDVVELELNNSGYRALPGKYDVIVAAPMGTLHADPRLGFFFWNATEACYGFEEDTGPQVDDAGFLLRLLDELIANYPVDPKGVYIYGYSNGGFMAHRMACDHADRFAAVVSGAGATFKDPGRCAPSVPISVLEVHSRADQVILFGGGNNGPPELLALPEYEYPGAIETVEQWGDVNGCKGELRFGKKPVFDMSTAVEGKETTINRITGCPHGVDVELWSMEGVPHPPLFFGVGPDGIKTWATETWQFLRRHRRH